MPQWYDTLDHQPAVDVKAPQVVDDVEMVTILTKPSAITATVPVPRESWVAGAAGGLLTVVAQGLEQLVAGNDVVAGTPAQDLNLANLLKTYVELVVEYDRQASGLPPLYGWVRVPIEAFYLAETGIGGFVPPGTVTPAEYVKQEYDRLAALA